MSNLPQVRADKHTVDEMRQLVSFQLDAEEYGVDVLSVREIIRLPEITKTPNCPDYVDGIINLRGTVVPIISLRKRFGLYEKEHDRHSRILVMERGGRLTGFVVDAVSEVLRVSAASIQPPPSLVSSGSAQDCLTGVINHGERLLIVIEPARLLGDELDTQYDQAA